MATISLLTSLAWLMTFKTVVSQEKLFMPPHLVGRALSNHLLSTSNTPEFSDCVLKCEEEGPCLSVNYREDVKICEMNNARLTDDVKNFIKDSASKYAQLDAESKPIHGACNSTPCGSRGICMPDCGNIGFSCLCLKEWTGDNCQYPPAVTTRPIDDKGESVTSDSITTKEPTTTNTVITTTTDGKMTTEKRVISSTSSKRPSTISPTTSETSTVPNKQTTEEEKSKTTNQEPDVYSECYYEPNGIDYRGRVSVTRKGVSCQEWSSDQPHDRAAIYESMKEVAGLDKNYCRNPDHYDQPWCFTMDPLNEWDICTILNCSLARLAEAEAILVDIPGP